MGHAGALVFGDTGTFASKKARLEEAGARVFETTAALVSACRQDHPGR
jgi:succinyl-CoA synthetase alpha subunit